MTDIKLFSLSADSVEPLESSEAPVEKVLQVTMERHLEVLLGVCFLASEYSTGQLHGGRIDTLGIDENNCPVIIEYKRATNENVINQGLFYLDWLMDHRAEFQLLMQKKLGHDQAEVIEWEAPRLLCIAGGFTKYDGHAVKQMNRNIELIKYTLFASKLLALELVNSAQAQPIPSSSSQASAGAQSATQYKHFADYLDQSSDELKSLFEQFDAFCRNLGDDVQVKTLKLYQAYKRIKNFACAEVRPQLGHVLVFLRLNPDDVEPIEGLTRDVREVGHYGTGDLEIVIRNPGDLKRLEPLIAAAYENG